MNITRVILGTRSDAELIHVTSGALRGIRTAQELQANVASLSARLQELGVRSADRVLILGASRIEIVESILAAFNIGAVAIPVSLLLGRDHLKSIIASMRPACCIFEDPPEEPLQLALAECASVLISVKASAAATAHGWRVYRDLLRGPPATRAFPDHGEFSEHPNGHPALVVHGSGSSGALKAVTMTQGELLTYLEYNRLCFAQYSDGPDVLGSCAATVNYLPLTHLAGLGNCLLSLMNGQRTFLLNSFVPETYLRVVEEAACAHILLVPSLYRSLLKEPYLGTMNKSALRFCIVGGEPSPDELLAQIERAFEVPVLTVYSMTECLSGLAHMRRDLFFTRVPPGSCGRPFFGEHSLRDTDANEQPELGELWVRNATVHPCYLDPNLNAERLREGWFRTGDLFFRDAAGNYFHRGRLDDMFICNGKNIYPVEIERILAAHPAVEMVCAGPVTLPEKGPVPAAMIVANAPVNERDLQEFCMRQGPSYAVPQVIRFARGLPLLGPGKINRLEVRRLLQHA